ncbi:MAG: hypothetical protein UY21_C0028G0001 [Microgenomates group bacterium GW2011_GWA1_48_10]|nr:MAG: hypothetical protein UY21_C0028G0001 [Microgenomates group bacterium GW2011_GWA1_48_10]
MSDHIRSFFSGKDARKKGIAIALVAIVALSFAWRFTARIKHFQECDSSAVYAMVSDTYGIQGQLGEKLEKTANEDSAGFYRSLANTRLALRFYALSAVSVHAFRSLLTVPFASTYSAGSGFIYGLVSHEGMNYQEFLSRAVTITLLLFHVSVLLLYFTLRRMGISAGSALLASLVMLFSISLSSYGYHLGSTVWNYASGFLWCYLLARFWRTPKTFWIVAVATAVLIFFNYLIILFWFSFIFAVLWSTFAREGRRTMTREIVRLARSQWLVAIAILVVLFFYPPGQGNRVDTILSSFFSDSYYIVLNFFSFSAQNTPLDVIVFLMGGAAVAAFFFAKRMRNRESSSDILGRMLVVLCLLFLFFVAVGVLGSAPSRHILFLAPLVFIGLAEGIEAARTYVAPYISYWVIGGASALLLFFGFVSMGTRMETASARMADATNPRIQGIATFYCMIDTIERMSVEYPVIKATSPELLQKGAVYLYVDRKDDFRTMQKQWEASGRSVKIDVLSVKENASNTYFVARNPDPGRLGGHEPNALYQVLFHVIENKPIH